MPTFNETKQHFSFIKVYMYPLKFNLCVHLFNLGDISVSLSTEKRNGVLIGLVCIIFNFNFNVHSYECLREYPLCNYFRVTFISKTDISRVPTGLKYFFICKCMEAKA